MKDGGLVLTQTGKLVHAIFGFCDIRNFTDCTEVLRADIVKLVNGVARHVHMCTKDSHGAPNKNIGDAFLLVWKPKGEKSISDVADASLQSYVRVIVQMQMCDDLRRLERRSALQHRMPGFQVRLGFGLHYGWAVEGAIGSEHKIDVSYLSPHVNMASRLEAATKQYGTAILLSDSIFGLMSEPIQSQCRLVDRVTVKGSQQPVSLYTYDVPDIKSRGGILPDDVRLADPSLSIKDFFRAVVPPATTFEFRRLHKAGVQLYLGGPDGSRSNPHQSPHTNTVTGVTIEKCVRV
jgi:class 3 adenylate cyclase